MDEKICKEILSTPGDSNTKMSGSSSSNESAKMDGKNSEMFCSLLEMFKMSTSEGIAQKLCLMSQLPMVCEQMRNYGCLPMLVRLLHQHSVDDLELDGKELQRIQKTNRDLAQTLSNIINHTYSNKKEIKILKILEDLNAFVEILYRSYEQEIKISAESVDHPCNLIVDLYKMCCSDEPQSVEWIELFGGVYVISEVIKADFKCHKQSKNENCYKIRLYSLMIMTHLTFNNPKVKSILGSKKSFLDILISLLQQSNEDLIQAIAKVFQNLSWDTNYISMQTMRDVQTITHLTNSLLKAKKESTMKCLLSALENLTASSPPNKADFCKVDGGLKFLISVLSSSNANQKTTDDNDEASTPNSYSMAIVEASGCILRNISSYLATEERYRQQLRDYKVIPLLLEHLESSSLDVVANACVILANLSATISQHEAKQEANQDQLMMIEFGAMKKLVNLKNSKHKIIREGAQATYRHLLHCYAATYNNENGSTDTKLSTSMSCSSFTMRKMKLIKDELSSLEIVNSGQHPTGLNKMNASPRQKQQRFPRSTSHDSIREHSAPATSNGQTLMTKSALLTKNQPTNDGDLCSDSFTTSTPTTITRASSQALRNCDNGTNSFGGDFDQSFIDGVSSEYDIFCGDAKCQTSNSISRNGKHNSTSSASTSFIEEEIQNEIILDDDGDYTTDFSERYKEQTMDDADDLTQTTPNNSADTNSATIRRRSQPQAVKDSTANTSADCDNDVLKVYQTEGTPLVSLAPSLSDLRDINEHKTAKTSQIRMTANKCLKQKTMDPTHDKPSSSSSTPKTQSKSQAIDPLSKGHGKNSPSDDLVELYGPNDTTTDSAIKFETEDTPAIFSLATSLSSLTVDDEEEDDENKQNAHPETILKQSKSITINNVNLTSTGENNTKQKFLVERRLEPIGSDDKQSNGKIVNNKNARNDNESGSQMEHLEKQQTTSTNCQKPKLSPKPNVNQQEKSTKEKTDSYNNLGVTKPEQDDDEEDEEQILKQCIECALPSQKPSSTKNSSTVSTSSINTKANNNNSQTVNNNSGGKLYIKSRNGSTTPKRILQILPPTKMNMANLVQQQQQLLQQKTNVSSLDQKKQFHVEDTPVQFSECHSPLSSLSFESDNNCDDNQLLAAAIDLGMIGPSSSKTTINSNAITGGCKSTSAQSSTIRSLQSTNITASTIPSSIPVPNGNLPVSSASLHRKMRNNPTMTNVAKTTTSNTNQAKMMVTSQNKGVCSAVVGTAIGSGVVSPSQSSNGKNTTPKPMDLMDHSDLLPDEDEKTYTISSRQSMSSSNSSTRNQKPILSGRRSADDTSASLNHQHQSSTIIHTSAPASATSFRSPNVNKKTIGIRKNEPNANASTKQQQQTSRPIPVPSARTTLQKNNNSQTNNNNKLVIPENSVQSDMGSFEDKSQTSLLENTKPPSIMDHSSLMSHSSASSIDSEISDIGYDQVPIRKSSKDLIVAVAASNCAKEINTLVQSCINNDNGENPDSSSSLSLSGVGKRSNQKNSDHFASTNDRTFEIVNEKTNNKVQQPNNLTANILPSKLQPSTSNSNSLHLCDTRTYNKNDTNEQSTSGKANENKLDGYNYYESEESDTDISEVLPLDDDEDDDDDDDVLIQHNQTNRRKTKKTDDIGDDFEDEDCPTATIVVDSKDKSKSKIQNVLYSRPPNIDVDGKNKGNLFEIQSTNRNKSKTTKKNNQHYSYGHQLDQLEQFEKETRYRPHSRSSTKNINLAYQMHPSHSMYPFASNTNTLGSSSNSGTAATHYTQHSRSLTRGHKFGVPKADFEDKDLLFTSKHRDHVSATQQLYFQQSKSQQQFKTASKYFDRHHEMTIPTPITTSLSNNDLKMSIKSDLDANIEQISNVPKTQKDYSSTKSLLSNVKSKLTASFSSSSNSSSLSNNGKDKQQKEVVPKKKNEVKSKITSFWRRSKSTHEKLDQNDEQKQHQARSSEVINVSLPSTPNSTHKQTILNRMISARRSVANQEIKQTGSLVRNTTYDSLSERQRQQQNSNDNNRNMDNQYLFDDQQQSSTQQFSSINKNRLTTTSAEASNDNNFTFMTFVKSPSIGATASNSNSSSLSSTLNHNHSSNNNNHQTVDSNSNTVDQSKHNNNNETNTDVTDSERQDSNNNLSSSMDQNTQNETNITTTLPPIAPIIIGCKRKTITKRKKSNPNVETKVTVTGNLERMTSFPSDNNQNEGNSSSANNRKTCLVTTV